MKTLAVVVVTVTVLAFATVSLAGDVVQMNPNLGIAKPIGANAAGMIQMNPNLAIAKIPAKGKPPKPWPPGKPGHPGHPGHPGPFFHPGQHFYPGVAIYPTQSYVPAAPVVSLPLALSNPAQNGVTIRCLLNGEVVDCAPGSQFDLPTDRAWEIQFDRGGSFGTARYSMASGLHRFTLTASGWELVREQDNGYLAQGVPANPLP